MDAALHAGAAHQLFMKDPPGRAQYQDQTAAKRAEEFHALLSKMDVASWIAATGCEALHCATMSRAQPSHWPHWVATPSSSWISLKHMPARTWRAISRSDTRWHTQTIMAASKLAGGERCASINTNYYHLQTVFLTPAMGMAVFCVSA